MPLLRQALALCTIALGMDICRKSVLRRKYAFGPTGSDNASLEKRRFLHSIDPTEVQSDLHRLTCLLDCFVAGQEKVLLGIKKHQTGCGKGKMHI